MFDQKTRSGGGLTTKPFPLNLFGIAFGLSGLAGTWSTASEALEIDPTTANVLWILATIVWATSLIRYVGAHAASGRC